MTSSRAYVSAVIDALLAGLNIASALMVENLAIRYLNVTVATLMVGMFALALTQYAIREQPVQVWVAPDTFMNVGAFCIGPNGIYVHTRNAPPIVIKDDANCAEGGELVP